MRLKSKAGITFIELIVVLAVMAIIGAIVVPNFLGVTEGARLRADIQSTMVLRNAHELYRLQNPNSSNASNMNTLLENMYRRNFISNLLVYTDPQTEGSTWIFSNSNSQLIMLSVDSDIWTRNKSNLTPQERLVVEH